MATISRAFDGEVPEPPGPACDIHPLGCPDDAPSLARTAVPPAMALLAPPAPLSDTTTFEEGGLTALMLRIAAVRDRTG